MRWRSLLFLLFALTGCMAGSPTALPQTPTPPTVTSSSSGTATATPDLSPSASPTQAVSAAPTKLQPSATPTAAPSMTPTATAFVISSPLQGIRISELPDILTQDFIQPRPGQDDGHYGVDYAYYRRGDQLSILGTPVLSVLPGSVAAVLFNRPPFGNAIMVETRLADLPAEWVAALHLPPLPNPLPVVDRVPCDLSDVPELLAVPDESLYLIYAHFNLTPTLQMGEWVASGSVLGEVGNSGYSGNPHLHLEAHVGPAGVAFGSLAFYEVGTTEQERHNYCLWRMSGVFRAFDPRILFGEK